MKGIHGCLTQLVAYLYSFFFFGKKIIWFLFFYFFAPQSFIIVSDREFEIIGVLLLDIDQIQLIFCDAYLSLLRESLTTFGLFHSGKKTYQIS